MITAKQLKDTYPHRQMRMYIEDEYAHMTPEGRAAKLGALVKKFLTNFKNQFDGWEEPEVVPRDIDGAFTWQDTPEGHAFWRKINGYAPEEIVEIVKPVKAKAPKKRIGWWV